MSIRWRVLLLCMVGTSVMIVALLQFYRLSNKNMGLVTEGERAQRIHLAVQRIDLLAYEQAMYGEPRARRQLALQCAELKLMARDPHAANNPHEIAIAHELTRTEGLLHALDAQRPINPVENPVMLQGRGRFLAEQLIIASHELFDHARTWQREMVAAREQLMREATISGILASSAMLLLMTTGGLLLLNTILRPVESLRKAVAAVAAGEPAPPLPPSGPDELGMLTEGFNQMIAALAVAARERERVVALEARGVMLERVNRDLEHFAALASHDLQAPLRSISNFTELIQRRVGGQLDDRANTHLQRIVEASTRMRELIESLLRFSRAGSADLSCDSDVASRSALDQALENLNEPLVASGAHLEIDELPTVRCDGVQLIQVFQNLIGNAIAYRDRSRALIIRITTRSGQPGYHTFLVADNGPGVPAEQRDRIFGMFHRGHGHDQVTGSGIGLALCKKIVHSRGGEIGVESVVGSGAIFWFSVPAAGTPPPSRRLSMPV